jgi:hypothetical protein
VGTVDDDESHDDAVLGAVWLTVWLVPGVAGPHRRSASTRLLARRSPWPNASPRRGAVRRGRKLLRAPWTLLTGRTPGRDSGQVGWLAVRQLAPNLALRSGRPPLGPGRAARGRSSREPSGVGRGATRDGVRGGPSLLGVLDGSNARTAAYPTLSLPSWGRRREGPIAGHEHGRNRSGRRRPRGAMQPSPQSCELLPVSETRGAPFGSAVGAAVPNAFDSGGGAVMRA